jgi:hypothetical protein
VDVVQQLESVRQTLILICQVGSILMGVSAERGGKLGLAAWSCLLDNGEVNRLALKFSTLIMELAGSPLKTSTLGA